MSAKRLGLLVSGRGFGKTHQAILDLETILIARAVQKVAAALSRRAKTPV
jgi:hypothetical protein